MDQLNINTTACLKSTTNLLETIVTNVCTGAVSPIPHGTLDLAAMAIVFALAAIILSFLLRIMLHMVFGY